MGEDLKNLKIDRETHSKGLFLGEDKKGFKPSLALLEMIAKDSKRKAFLNEKGAWMFICGRDVFGESIEKSSVEEGLVLVQNDKDENLGYGKIWKKKGELFIKNILDKGDYLRREN